MSGARLEVLCGSERLSLPLAAVREAVRAGRVTPLPGAPARYAGLSLLRGEPIGVLAPAGDPRTRGAAEAFLVVLDGTPHALLVDRIVGVTEGAGDARAVTPEALVRGNATTS